MKRARASRLDARSGDSTFAAKRFSNVWCSTRYTTAIPPTPIGSSTRYTLPRSDPTSASGRSDSTDIAQDSARNVAIITTESGIETASTLEHQHAFECRIHYGTV